MVERITISPVICTRSKWVSFARPTRMFDSQNWMDDGDVDVFAVGS